jgi:hypothetical protein
MTEPTPVSPDDTARETRIVDVRGRAIVVRKLVDAQYMFLNREAHLLQQDGVAPARKIDGIRRIFNTLESQVVEGSDRDYLMDLVSTGDLELKELMGFISEFNEPAEDAKPKVRRGRRPAAR